METTNEINYINALLPLAGIVFIIAVGVVLLTQQFRKNLYRQKLEQEELKNKHQMELLRSSINVQEKERKRISMDMHDELGAALSITRMHLLQAEKEYGKNEKLLNDLQNIRNLTETSLANMRRISHELMPPQLESFGLIKTLEFVSEQLSKTGDIKLEIKMPEIVPDMSFMHKLAFYRIFMELINNTIKHSGANKISIELNFDSQSIIGVYSDNGKGLTIKEGNDGVGLKSIEGRIKALNGTITIGNSPQGGFNASIKIPLSK